MSLKYKDKNILDLLTILRSENLTQYVFLIKMHLSFLTDRQTDQCDGSFDSSNSINSSKRYLSPIMKRLSRGNTNQNSSKFSLNNKNIYQVFHIIQYLKKRDNISQEGLFRKNGSVVRQAELKLALQNGCNLNLECGIYSAHDCASVLKSFLSGLPEPILHEKEYHVHCRIAEMCRKNMTSEQVKAAHNRQVKALSLIFLLLPSINYELLKELLLLLHQVTLHQKSNKMSSSNLGTMFAPHILCPKKISPNELQCLSGSLSSTVAFIIENAPELFEIPAELVIDVREYFRTKNFEKNECKNPLEIEPTKTSHSFVDRELTAEANDKDVTKIALAQLYAYVHSMPESSKKKKLISKFNEASGLGTPKCGQSFQKNDIRPKCSKGSWKKRLKIGNPKNSFKKALGIKSSSSADDFGKLVMTPRSRQPLVINSSSSLPSVPMLEKAAQFQEEKDNRAIMDAHRISSKENNFTADESWTLPSKEDYFLRNVFKRLSTSSLINLVSKLKHTDSTLGEVTDTVNCSNCNNSSHNETLTSVFKEYLLTRSIDLTDNPAHISLDDDPGEEDTYISEDLNLNNSFQVFNDFSNRSPLSASLLYCLDGNSPSHMSSTTKDLTGSLKNKKGTLQKEI